MACGAASFLAGVFIDIDHVFDFVWNYGPRFNVRKFYDYCMDCRYERLSLIFHSYELIVGLWIAIFALSLGDIWKAVAIGLTQHLILDNVRNIYLGKMTWPAYFFSYRLFHKFKVEKIVKKK